MTTPNTSNEFTEDQKNYLQGFVSGSELARSARGLPTFAGTLGIPADQLKKPHGEQTVTVEITGPDRVGYEAQSRLLAAGKKLTPQEEAKRRRHPLDMWDDLVKHASEDRFPKGDDVLAFKYHGLFFVGPAQDAYMCRLRLPGGIVSSHQLRGIATIAGAWGGGYTDVTTRANLQIREIPSRHGPDVLLGLQDLGIIARGSGADNIRNVTGSATAGIDPDELIDTRPLTKAMHYHIIHHRDMYGLPRKFNIAFDGGGTISALEDTNDVGFTAVNVGPGKAIAEGVYFRLMLGGISGHKDFALDEGILLKPEECVPVAAAVVQIFNQHGDRTDRKKARLKYILDAWGHAKFVEEVQKILPFQMTQFPLSECEPRPKVEKHGHLGVHPQKQPGKFYLGVLVPVGRILAAQMNGLADLAEKYGSGTIRLTVWQNLLISDVDEADMPALKAGVEALGLHWEASNVRGGLVACTGNAGCKFAASNTKRHAMAIADHLDEVLELDRPVNIHLTGCPNSCAQHYLGDIGLLGTGVTVGEGDEADTVEGYHLYVGGGYGEEREIARELFRSIPATEVPFVLERMLKNYQEARESADESFNDFVRRHEIDALKVLFENGVLAGV